MVNVPWCHDCGNPEGKGSCTCPGWHGNPKLETSMQISAQKKQDAILSLTMAIEAAEASNDAGERAVMAASKGILLLGALKRLMPELRRMRDEGFISVEQLRDAENAVAAAEGKDDAAPAPRPTKQPVDYALIQDLTGLPLSVIRANMGA